jgi:REP element-mobilizing transposase RayT
MANTYTQLYVQYVFAVKFRESLVTESWRPPLQKYMTGIAQNYGHKMLSIYCMPDHTHVLVGLNPNQSVSTLAKELKSSSSKWINQMKWTRFQFNWQEGYGAFSYDKSRMYRIADYIQGQPEHHRKKSFQEEYLELLEEFGIEFKNEYLFEFWDGEGNGKHE